MRYLHHQFLFTLAISLVLLGCGSGQAEFTDVSGANEEEQAKADTPSESSDASVLIEDTDKGIANDNKKPKDKLADEGGAETKVSVNVDNDVGPQGDTADDPAGDPADSSADMTTTVDIATDDDTVNSMTDLGDAGETDADTGPKDSAEPTTATAGGEETKVENEDTAAPVTDSAVESTEESPNAPQTLPPEEDSPETVAAVGACAKANGVDKRNVKVTGTTEALVVKASEYLLVRATGNQSKVTISSTGGEGAIAGICVFAAGNKSNVDVTLGLNVGSLHYFGTGNQHKGHIAVMEGATIEETFVKLRGNSAYLKMDGPGSYGCANADVKGKKSTFDCYGE